MLKTQSKKPLFKKKHHMAFAEHLSSYRIGKIKQAPTLRDLCDFFLEDNPNFDEAKFIKAVESKETK